MKKNYEKEEFLARWLSGDISDKERKEFESTEDFKTFNAIAELSKTLKTPTIRKDKVWKEIEEQTQTTAKIRPMRRWLFYAAAVAVLGLFGLFFLFQNQMTTYTAPLATKQQFTLPDGSEVLLNAGSKITCNGNNFLENRQLQLEGEAFFKVKEGSKFLVETVNGNIQVLGTSFNVFSRKNKLDVTCYTGLVGVYFDKKENINELSPDNKIIAKNGIITSRISLKDRLSPEWTSGNSRFYLAKMTEVIDELERQFDIEISYPPEFTEINDYNGGFPHDDLETALNIVFSSLASQFEINGNKVRVFK